MLAGGIIFDLDNTLIQSHIDFRRMARALVARAAERLGPEALPAGLEGRPIAHIVETLSAVDPAMTPELWQIVAHHEAEGMQNLELEPGALGVIRRLAQEGRPMAICTNNARPATLAALAPFGEPLPFDVVVTRDEVRRLKPDPEGVLHIKAEWSRRGDPHFDDGGRLLAGRKGRRARGSPVRGVPGAAKPVPREPIPVWRRIEYLEELFALLAGGVGEQGAGGGGTH